MKTLSVTIDSAGRIVLPKSIRERMHLRTGSELRLTIRGEEVVLTRTKAENALVNEGGFWVHRGELRGKFVDEIARLRDERQDARARAGDDE